MKSGADTVEGDILDRIVGTIVERFDAKRIVLFGSRARGEADPESDFDLFVEMETTRKPLDRIVEVSSAFGIHEWPMDIFVYTPEESARFRRIRGTLASIVQAEGKVLYERS